jgi:exodeoxyribonuclease VII large subunit
VRPELDLGPEPGPEPTLTVGELHAAVRRILAPRFNRRAWVRGEVRDLNEHGRSGHLYFTLCEPGRGRRGRDATLRAACWSTTWTAVRRSLRRAGVALADGNEVRVGGRIELNDSAQLTFVVEVVDVDALVGRLARARAELCTALREEGLWDANRSLPLSPLPLRIGLVGAPGSQGFADFRGALEASGFGFSVTVAPAVVQGPQAPASIASAFRALRVAHERGVGLDLVVAIRGGGSKSDLAPFDSEIVARALAASPVPVWTGVGHTDDRSVADELAHHCFPTPTALAHGLVTVVSEADAAVAARARRVTRAAHGLLSAARDTVGAHQRHLRSTGRAAVRAEHRRVVHESLRVEQAARAALVRADAGVGARTAALAPSRVLAALGRADARVASQALAVRNRSRAALRMAGSEVERRRVALAGLDPERILELGYSLTRRDDGALVREASALRPGDTLVTQFARGTTRSRVVEEST